MFTFSAMNLKKMANCNVRNHAQRNNSDYHLFKENPGPNLRLGPGFFDGLISYSFGGIRDFCNAIHLSMLSHVLQKLVFCP